MISKITIDARWLVGGIGTYTRHLLKGLSRYSAEVQVHAITRREHRDQVAQWCSQITLVDVPIYTIREQFMIPAAAKGCDVLHVPHYNAPLIGKHRLVTSILDLIHMVDPAHRSSVKSWVYARPMLHLAARRAEQIVTISEYSKMQIVERLGVPESSVSVIHCGVNGEFTGIDRQQASEAVASAMGIPGPYVLYVGNLKPHKNVSCLLRAFALLHERRAIPHRLLIIGSDKKGTSSLALESSQLGISDKTDFISSIEQDLLPKIYAAADVLVMPSRIEGFGLPVLEAMSCGTPVVCSNAASLPEVGGDAAAYFDPSNVEELLITLERILDSPSLQDEMRKKGIRQAARFSWQESARQHMEVYRKVLQ